MKFFFKRKSLTKKQIEMNKKQTQQKLDFYLPDEEFIPIAKLFQRRYYDDELIIRLADFFEVSEAMVAVKLFNTGLISTI
jgi:hypothetical protein